MKIFIGFDVKDIRAYDVLVASLYRHSSMSLEIHPVKQHELRWKGIYGRPYWTDAGGQMWDDRDGKPFSTDFSFTRFCVPMMNDFRDEWVVFMDPDMMFRTDIADMMALVDRTKAVSVVKHTHSPAEQIKMGGLRQELYLRKNWSSLMVMNTARCMGLSSGNVNYQTGAWLHSFGWMDDDEIGGLPESWNWLEGWSEGVPDNVHFTRGTPDMPGCENFRFATEWWGYLHDAAA